MREQISPFLDRLPLGSLKNFTRTRHGSLQIYKVRVVPAVDKPENRMQHFWLSVGL
jgi:hypothetical protein